MKIVLVAPNFFGLDKDIRDELNRQGNSTVLFNEKAQTGIRFLDAILEKLPSRLYTFLLHHHLRRIAKYSLIADRIVLIRIEKWFAKDIVNIIGSNKNSTVYQWDSSRNLPLMKSQFVEDVRYFTFDPNDAEKLDLHYKPLFIPVDYSSIPIAIECKNKFKLCFIGSHYSDRAEVVKKIMAFNCLREENFFVYMYRPLGSYLYSKFSIKNLHQVSLKDIKLFPLNRKHTIAAMRCAQAIVDISEYDQAGLSLRVLEAIGLRKKLITTNRWVVNSDLYHPNNIHIIDREAPIIDNSFFDLPYITYDESIYARYSLSAWVKHLIQ